MEDKISFNDRTYVLREIEFENEIVYVASMDLNNALFNENGENVSANAKNIDKQILFFLDNEQMK